MLGFAAVVFATINVVGGYLVTDRMLGMFKKKGAEDGSDEPEPSSTLALHIASILFIFGLKRLRAPRTAVRGNLLGAVGMLLAVVATLLEPAIVGLTGV